MKRSALMCMMLLSFILVSAQVSHQTLHIAVGLYRTISIVFPAKIISVDRGSERIAVQKSVDNILRVKAETVFADTTSLTVITTDGKLFSFLVHFHPSPSDLTLNLSDSLQVISDTSLTALAQKAITAKNNLQGIKTTESRIELTLLGIYTTGELVICKMRVKNNSSFSYAIDNMQVFTRDRQVGKRRSVQERPVDPLLSFVPGMIVREKSMQVWVVILPKPTLNQCQRLHFALTEKGGERNLPLSVSNNYLLKAMQIDK